MMIILCVCLGVGLLAESATSDCPAVQQSKVQKTEKEKKTAQRKKRKETVLTGEKEPDGDLFCVQESVDFLCNLLPSARYSHLVSMSIADTARNPGILHIVLQVEGEAWNADAMKTKMFEHVLERRNKDTSLAFPFMKCTLHNKWGHYAWADAS
uniref:Uncharacterized protein n=1 Tax=Phlebotomus papatasi TaxID=29031 RepID=A0A1B0D691_PHLPP